MNDLRFAVRMLVKDSWFTAIAVIALALGIGLNTTVFTFVNAVLLRGLPFRDADRIMHVNSSNLTQGREELPVAYLDFQEWRAQSHSFSQLGAFEEVTMNVSDLRGVPERVRGALVTANTYRMLGQQPLLGRDFMDGEDRRGADPVVILGYGVWMDRYGGDRGVLGQTIKINEVPCTIVGVMPEGMKFPNNAAMWQPLVPTPQDGARDHRRLNVFGRLSEGATLAQAQTELSGIAARLAQQYPDTNKGVNAVVMSYNDRFNGGPIKLVFLALMGAVGFVLLIACANVANLLLSRSAQRAREIAVRVALGASRGRIIRQLLVESILLSCLGGVFGLLLSFLGVRAFAAAVADVDKPYWIDFSMDFGVFAYLALVCLGTGLLFGLAPAFQVSKSNVNETLKEGGRSSAGGPRARRFTATMVVAELTLTLVLLAGAGLMGRSFLALYSMDWGLRTERLLTMRLALAELKYPEPAHLLAFHERLWPRLAALPGVEEVTMASHLPIGGADDRAFDIDGQPWPQQERRPSVATVIVGPRYFETLGVRLRGGRVFTATDGAPGSESAIVNQRFVARFFPDGTAIGKRIRLEHEDKSRPSVWATIVGVSPVLRQNDPQDPEPAAVVYVPFRQEPTRFVTILARSRTEPGALTTLLRREVQAVDPNQPVYNVGTLDELLKQNRWAYTVFGTMFGIFALIALALSAVGIYAVTAYSVSQRTQEIGVRMALGARQADVSWLILRQGVTQLAIGLTLGLAGAIGVGRILRSLMVGTSGTDPVTFIAIACLLAVVMMVACLVPARRASRLDPLQALRAE